MQNRNPKPKTYLKRRAYQYSIRISFKLNETKELANILGSSILTLKDKKRVFNFELWFLAFIFKLLIFTKQEKGKNGKGKKS